MDELRKIKTKEKIISFTEEKDRKGRAKKKKAPYKRIRVHFTDSASKVFTRLK